MAEKIFVFVDSREASISQVREFLREEKKLKNLDLVCHVQTKTLVGCILAVTDPSNKDHASENDQLVIAMRLPSSELIGEINDKLASLGDPPKCTLISHRDPALTERWSHITLEKNKLEKRTKDDDLRSWVQYKLMRLIISREELCPEELKKLIITENIPSEDKKSVDTFVVLGEPDMAGGTYASEGDSENSIDEIRRIIKINAGSDRHVMIIGESGTGKETAAWATHELSSRRKKPFLALNCAAMPDELMESELFGYLKGSHSAATGKASAGLVGQANGGTLFLDEFPDMSPRVQAKMLRFCQTGEYRPLGGENKKADVRIIAGAQPARLAPSEKSDTPGVRTDLLYRLNKLQLVIPPLREMEKKSPGTILKIATILLERYTWDSIKGEKATPEMIEEWKIELKEEPFRSHVTMYNWSENNIRELDTKIFQWLIYGDEYFVDALRGPSLVKRDPLAEMKKFVACYDKDRLPRVGTERSQDQEHQGEEGPPKHILWIYTRAVEASYPDMSKAELAQYLCSSGPTIANYLTRYQEEV